MENIPDLPPDAQPTAEVHHGGAEAAGFWIRAGAYTIDAFVVAIPQFILVFILALAGIPSMLLNLIGLALQVGYYTWMPAAFNGQTVGKMAAGIAIIRTDGTGLSYGRAFGRWVGYWLSLLPAGLGFLAAAFTEHKRALHDYVADTRVVYIQAVSTGRKAAVIAVGLLIPLIVFVGILAAIAVPKFANLSGKANEGATKGNLGAMRAALSIYYGDQEGVYPQSLLALTEDGKYLTEIPTMKVPPHHPDSNGVELYGAEACASSDEINGESLRDSGNWGYVADPEASCFGALFVDCTHEDSRGKEWFSF